MLVLAYFISSVIELLSTSPPLPSREEKIDLSNVYTFEVLALEKWISRRLLNEQDQGKQV